MSYFPSRRSLTPNSTDLLVAMRTNVELDDTLVEEAFRLSNIRTKKELLHLA